MKQLPCFYSWGPDPEAEATDTFMQNWAMCRATSMVPDTALPGQSQEAGGEDSPDNIIVENPIMVASSIGTSGGSPLEDSSAAKPTVVSWGKIF